MIKNNIKDSIKFKYRNWWNFVWICFLFFLFKCWLIIGINVEIIFINKVKNGVYKLLVVDIFVKCSWLYCLVIIELIKVVEKLVNW